MKKRSSFMQSFEQLPNTLAIFPLANAVFLPGGHLPLNIFEPRYLNMIHDSMMADHLIGMIQPSDAYPPLNLVRVGCAGRITRYEEIGDGRLEILLTGLCRFEVTEELTTMRGYRLIIPDWSCFRHDMSDPESASAEGLLLFRSALRSYLQRNSFEVDWEILDRLDPDGLINSLCSYLPISAEEKQILVETDTHANRLAAFTAILGGDAEPTTLHH